MRIFWMITLAATALLLSACSPQSSPSPTEAPATQRPAGMQTPSQVAAPPQRESVPQESPGAPPTPGVTSDPEEQPPPGASSEFSTDFSLHSVPYREILSGGPPKDGIPAIDNPQFVSVTAADEWLADREPVILFQLGEDVRAYPLQILIWHEITNDTVDGGWWTVDGGR